MLLVGHEQVELRVLLHLYAQFIETLDGGVAGEEVLGTRTEGDNLQPPQTDDHAGNGHKLGHHAGHLFGRSHGIFRDIALQFAHAQIIGAVQHAAVGVATTVDHVAVALGSGHKHAGAVEIFGDERLGSLGSEVAKEHHEGVATGLFHLGHGLEHVLLVLHGGGTIEEFALIGLHDVLAALGRQGNGETVTAHGDDAELDLGNVAALHNQ